MTTKVTDIVFSSVSPGSCGRRTRSLTTKPPPSPSSTTTLSSWSLSSSPPSSCSRTSTPLCILYIRLYMSTALRYLQLSVIKYLFLYGICLKMAWVQSSFLIIPELYENINSFCSVEGWCTHKFLRNLSWIHFIRCHLSLCWCLCLP